MIDFLWSLYSHVIFLWCGEKNSKPNCKHILELTKRKSDVQEKKMPSERGLNFNQWKTFSENLQICLLTNLPRIIVVCDFFLSSFKLKLIFFLSCELAPCKISLICRCEFNSKGLLMVSPQSFNIRILILSCISALFELKFWKILAISPAENYTEDRYLSVTN